MAQLDGPVQQATPSGEGPQRAERRGAALGRLRVEAQFGGARGGGRGRGHHGGRQQRRTGRPRQGAAPRGSSGGGGGQEGVAQEVEEVAGLVLGGEVAGEAGQRGRGLLLLLLGVGVGVGGRGSGQVARPVEGEAAEAPGEERCEDAGLGAGEGVVGELEGLERAQRVEAVRPLEAAQAVAREVHALQVGEAVAVEAVHARDEVVARAELAEAGQRAQRGRQRVDAVVVEDEDAQPLHARQQPRRRHAHQPPVPHVHAALAAALDLHSHRRPRRPPRARRPLSRSCSCSCSRSGLASALLELLGRRRGPGGPLA